LSSDAFQKFSPYEVYEKSSGRIFTIYASRYVAVSRKIQTHFRSFLSASFAEEVLGAISLFMRPKTNLFDMKLRRILEVFALPSAWKGFGRNFTIYASKNEAVSREIQTYFGRFLSASFAENVLGAISRVMRPKTKLFAVKLRRILEVLRLHGLQKKVLGAFSRFVCSANKHSWLQHFVKMIWARFTILHSHKFFLCCWNTLWYSWLSHFIRMHWIWTHLDCECTHKLWRADVTLCEALSNKSWTGTSVMFCNIWTSKEWADFANIVLR